MSEARVALVVCSELNGAGLDLAGLATWAEASFPAVRAAVISGLCRRWGQLEQALLALKGGAAVVVTCHHWQWEGELQHYSRRAGLSPLAVQVVPLARICQGDDGPTAKARAVLAGAIARGLAHAGAAPDHLKPVLMSLGQRVSRRAFLMLPRVTYSPIPAIRSARCVAWRGCRLCVAGCPQGALAWDGYRIVLDRDRCTGCGRCLALCPRLATDMPGWSHDEIAAQLRAVLELGGGRPIAYVCTNAPPPAGPWLPVWVRCASQVTLAALLWPLIGGAAAVAVGHCGPACRSGQRQAVADMVDACRQLLAALGLEQDRARLGDPDRLTNGLSLLPLRTQCATLPSPLRLWGAGADAQAVSALRDLLGANDLELAHPGLPLGSVRVNVSACTRCGACASGCPSDALAYEEGQDEVRLTFDASLCLACGNCVGSCPERQRGAIAVERRLSLAALREGRHELARDALLRCRRCNSVVATEATMIRLATMLGGQFRPEIMRDLCSDCRGLP